MTDPDDAYQLAKEEETIIYFELVDRVARAIRRSRYERARWIPAYDPKAPLTDVERADARAAVDEIKKR